jgi:hypothetical protein
MDNILVVTPPDDIHTDGFRLLLVDLTPDQSQIVSDSLLQLKSLPSVVVYSWKSDDLDEWLLQKKKKSDLIIFNADSSKHLLIGYLSAQINTYYFGTLRTLSTVNNRVLLNTDQCIELLDSYIATYKDSIN